MTENSASSACHREPAHPKTIYKLQRGLNGIQYCQGLATGPVSAA
jgi:hypothetical protein